MPIMDTMSEVYTMRESKDSVREKFREFINQNGGTPVFGIEIEMAWGTFPHLPGESSQKGFMLLTERCVLEWHPDNPEPYKIQLALLGKILLKNREMGYPDPEDEEKEKHHCQWFRVYGENGFCVCDKPHGFRSYWEQHGVYLPGLSGDAGSLFLFGLPLTNARMETNKSGHTVQTQWFERARFEWHPANPNPYKVQLGLLGNEYDPTWHTMIEPKLIPPPHIP